MHLAPFLIDGDPQLRPPDTFVIPLQLCFTPGFVENVDRQVGHVRVLHAATGARDGARDVLGDRKFSVTVVGCLPRYEIFLDLHGTCNTVLMFVI